MGFYEESEEDWMEELSRADRNSGFFKRRELGSSIVLLRFFSEEPAFSYFPRIERVRFHKEIGSFFGDYDSDSETESSPREFVRSYFFPKTRPISESNAMDMSSAAGGGGSVSNCSTISL